jgi:hypothetical protein
MSNIIGPHSIKCCLRTSSLLTGGEVGDAESRGRFLIEGGWAGGGRNGLGDGTEGTGGLSL